MYLKMCLFGISTYRTFYYSLFRMTTKICESQQFRCICDHFQRHTKSNIKKWNQIGKKLHYFYKHQSIESSYIEEKPGRKCFLSGSLLHHSYLNTRKISIKSIQSTLVISTFHGIEKKGLDKERSR